VLSRAGLAWLGSAVRGGDRAGQMGSVILVSSSAGFRRVLLVPRGPEQPLMTTRVTTQAFATTSIWNLGTL
jgi:hypothetical protein